MNLDDEMLGRLIEAVEAPDLSGTDYELRGEIGRGGMGVVYRAFDRRLEREVALKVVEGGEPGEAKIAASLEHPGIVPIYDAGVLADGRQFYAMRLVRGKPLDRIVEPGMPLSARIAIFQKICEAVAFAHSRGVVHRDLKPANIMVGEFGEVAVLDWGVARVESNAEAGGQAVVGTPKFMAPEQAAGGVSTRLSDVYSLGAVLGYLLPENAGRPLRAIAAKASAEWPGDRYGSAELLSLELGRFLDGLRVDAYQERGWERAGRFVKRNATLLLLVTAYFATRVAVYLFSGR